VWLILKGLIWGKCIKLLKITKGKLYAAGLWVSEDNPALLIQVSKYPPKISKYPEQLSKYPATVSVNTF